MEDRTREYLSGRFRDHYRRTGVELPPDAQRREWGYIPWTAGSGTTMVRHRSLLDLGDLGEFLTDESPRHVYFSAGRYDDPGNRTMSAKGWQSSDLIFDLDADHLPSIDPDDTAYDEMLAACKNTLDRLLDLLENDFGFEDLTVVFSGGRGYHVHVRDPGVRELGREERREIVDYVRGTAEFEDLLATESVAGVGRETPAEKRTLRVEGGWGVRVHRRIRSFVETVADLPEEAAVDRLQAFDGIGPKKAEAALRAIHENREAIDRGNVDVHPAFFSLSRILAAETFETESAPIDEPVTTDLRRLIRLPGSLHGGSGLAVRRIPRDELSEFEPLSDAVPETFVGNEIAIEVGALPGPAPGDATEVRLRGDSFTIEEGTRSLPEYVGVFLMCRGRAEKTAETT